MRELETGILQTLEAARTDVLNGLFEAITMLGEETLMVVLVAVLYFAFDKRLAVKVFFVTMVSMGVNGIVKNIAQVPRPFAIGDVSCVRPHTATGYSFPSGHTQVFSTWSTTLATHFKKPLLGAAAAVLIALVAFSRMFLGAHYPSDVLVGAVLGIGIGVAGCIAYDKVENKTLLHVGAVAVLTPFAIYFVFDADPMAKGFFGIYGMLAALPAALAIEARHGRLCYDVAWYKKVLRVLVALVLTLAVKEGLELLLAFDAVGAQLVSSALCSAAMIVVSLGLCPVLFKKLGW